MEKGFHNIEQFIAFITPGHTAFHERLSIGVDVYKRQLKQSVTRPFGQNVLRYQNTYYTLSTERIPYRKDKTEDDRFFILTLFALAGEIEARGAYSSEVQRIQLAVGLPPAHFGAQVERFIQYFGQRGMVEFEVQGKPYSIYIDCLLYTSQPFPFLFTSTV